MIPCILHPRGEAKRVAGSTDAAKGLWERLRLRERRRASMTHPHVSRREFLGRAGWGGLAATAALSVSGRTPAWGQGASSYPDFVAASTKPPRRGGILTRTTAWDPPVLDPRLTTSVGLFEISPL